MCAKLYVNQTCGYCKEAEKIIIKQVIENGGDVEIINLNSGVFPKLVLKDGTKLTGLDKIKKFFEWKPKII